VVEGENNSKDSREKTNTEKRANTAEWLEMGSGEKRIKSKQSLGENKGIPKDLRPSKPHGRITEQISYARGEHPERVKTCHTAGKSRS